MFVMTSEVMSMANTMPEELHPALVLAVRRWYGGDVQVGPLEPARILCWDFLQAKHGNGNTLIDREDISVRALICVLWDTADEGDDLYLGLDYFEGLLDHLAGLNHPGFDGASNEPRVVHEPAPPL